MFYVIFTQLMSVWQTSPPAVPKASPQAPPLCLLWWRTAPSPPAGSPTCPGPPPPCCRSLQLSVWSPSVPGTSPSLSSPGTSSTIQHHHHLHHHETPSPLHCGELHLRDCQTLPPGGHRQLRAGTARPEEHLQSRPGLLSQAAKYQHRDSVKTSQAGLGMGRWSWGSQGGKTSELRQQWSGLDLANLEFRIKYFYDISLQSHSSLFWLLNENFSLK